jgi:4,5-DOPA dioxygenase extradiol
MTAFPTLFLSHGAPDLLVRDTPAREFLSRFGREFCEARGRPQAILIASAHFDTIAPSFCADEQPELIYDFQGFGTELYQTTYPAPGLPQLATIAATLVEDFGFPVQEVTGRGLDHGAWVPLSLLFPEADIPVVEMAIQSKQGAGHHIALGRALAPLREHSVLVIGSGSLTHNLSDILRADPGGETAVPEAVRAFTDWVEAKVEAGAIDEIADYRALAPHAREMHPTPDHFVPLPFAFGAAGEGARGRRVHASVERGSMAMDAYLFE